MHPTASLDVTQESKKRQEPCGWRFVSSHILDVSRETGSLKHPDHTSFRNPSFKHHHPHTNARLAAPRPGSTWRCSRQPLGHGREEQFDAAGAEELPPSPRPPLQTHPFPTFPLSPSFPHGGIGLRFLDEGTGGCIWERSRRSTSERKESGSGGLLPGAV